MSVGQFSSTLEPMSIHTAENQLDRVFAALANRTRRDIMKLVSSQARTVGDIANEFNKSLNGVSKHLKVLQSASLLSRKKWPTSSLPSEFKTVDCGAGLYQGLRKILE